MLWGTYKIEEKKLEMPLFHQEPDPEPEPEPGAGDDPEYGPAQKHWEDNL